MKKRLLFMLAILLYLTFINMACTKRSEAFNTTQSKVYFMVVDKTGETTNVISKTVNY